MFNFFSQLIRLTIVNGLLVGVIAVDVSGQQGQESVVNQPSTERGEWPHYTGDLAGSRYSPLDQIDASNFNELEVAWRLKTDIFGPRPEFKLGGTPLMINGVLYTTAGTRRAVIAIDAETGELLWNHRMQEGRRATASPRQLSGRGVAYWTDGKGDERILYMTIGYRLVALDAKTGQLIESFGHDGVIDLKVGVVYGTGTQIDLESGEVGIHATPTIARDIVIVGSTFDEGQAVPTHNNSKGIVRAYSVRSGELLWTFHTIPRSGEFGNDTWLNESWSNNGNVGVWTQITVDSELGLVYLPVETPTSDLYGGHRPGENLFAESLVCLDLETGERKWHFQAVHHPIWNMDLPGAPLLADITVDGKLIKAVALPTKQSLLFMFDRETGEPIWPIEERPVPQGDVPGEWYSPTQPFPVKPPPYSRNELRIPDDLIDFTPEMRAEAVEKMKNYKVGPLYTPPIRGTVDGLLATAAIGAMGGGTNWPGAGFDPETGIFYSHAGNASVNLLSVTEPPEGFSDIRYVSGVKGREFRRPRPVAEEAKSGSPRYVAGGISSSRGLNVEGLLIVKPPYGILAAVDMNRGELLFQVPHGETPDAVRNHPKLQGMTIPKTGQGGATSNVGLLVTKTLVVLGDPQETNPPERPRGAMLRAYHKTTGEEVGAVYIPASQSGSPMTYMVNGRQYLMVAVSGRVHSGEYIAFTLPE
ncbi:MAG: quinoprotein glucose dehydrogenase [Solibacterales bacterium]|nr:quinoprotein glucose dehydrogenase [Bryobacterales bacterium]|tara:strand:- start:8475 stop:10574 length:2100 start_codon:yes stop_codon:yes gene_type:complete